LKEIRGKTAMDTQDFRRIARTLEGVEEGSHMGAADFRVGGRIFATLASQDQGYGNLMLTPEVQEQFVAEAPDVFLAIPGGCGPMGATPIRFSQASEDLLTGALQTAWKIRIERRINRKGARPAANALLFDVTRESPAANPMAGLGPLPSHPPHAQEAGNDPQAYRNLCQARGFTSS
jgi:hypothetical protein